MGKQTTRNPTQPNSPTAYWSLILVVWLVCLLFGCSAGWSVGWSAGWSVGCLVDLLCVLVGWLASWLVGLMCDWLIDWLVAPTQNKLALNNISTIIVNKLDAAWVV